MPEYRDPLNRTSRPAQGSRPAARPVNRTSGSGANRPRPAGARPAGSRPAGARTANGRPVGNRVPQGRRPAPRRRKKRTSPRFFIFAAVIAVIIVVLLIILLGGGKPGVDAPQATPTPAPNAGGAFNAAVGVNEDSGETPEVNTITDDTTQEELEHMLADSDAELTGIKEEDRIKTEDLLINTSLPSNVINVLLLGTDERNANDPARSDTMMIVSVNTDTGAIKLTSVMRDTAYKISGSKKFDGTYGLNAMNYFGGPKLTMRVLNECLGLNLQYYASINFFGFQQVATQLGGIDVDLSEAEMNELNKKQYEQAQIAYYHGFDEGEGIENETLTTYGPNTHLNGRQTVAYARIRKIDSDYTRTERQQTVIKKMAEKLRSKSPTEVIAIAANFMQYVTTNLDLDTIGGIALKVLSSNKTNIETFRVPVNGSYKEEKRNENALLYDTDWDTNKRELYNFIYTD